MLSDDIVADVRDLLQREMRPFGLTDIQVAVAPDHAGDPSLQIDADYDGEGRPVDPKIVAGLVTKLRDRLWAKGEKRFPYIRHHFPEDQKVVGFK